MPTNSKIPRNGLICSVILSSMRCFARPSDRAKSPVPLDGILDLDEILN